ncbi:MAG: hypothetical protein QXN16_04370 [Candidatus Micrarchaeaceae archaeon]
MTNEKTIGDIRGEAKHVEQVSSIETFQLEAGSVTVEKRVEHEFQENGEYTDKPKPYTTYTIEYIGVDRRAFGATISLKNGRIAVTPLKEGPRGYDDDYRVVPSDIVLDKNGNLLVETKEGETPVRIRITSKGIDIADMHINFPEVQGPNLKALERKTDN